MPHLWPTGSSWVSPSITARYFSSCPSDPTSRWTPCPPKYNKQWLQVRLGYIQLSPSCPFRRLHTFCFLRPARYYPAFGYGAPHSSARGTSTLLSRTLLHAHFQVADHSLRTRWSVCAGRHFNKPIWVSTEPSHAPLLKHVRPERTSRRGSAMKFTALLFDQGL